MKKKICLFLGFILLSFQCLADTENQVTAEGYQEAKQESEQEQKVKNKMIPDPKAQLPPTGKIPQNIWSLGDGDYFSKYAFVADKSTRTLTIWQNEQQNFELVAAYPFDMGKQDGDKQILGDLKTPEGVYFFEGTYKQAQLDYNEYGIRAFTTNYPNFFDRLEKKTGSGIWLHAIPPSKSLKRGSRGCLVIRNEAIEKVIPFVDLDKTPIIVEDKINYTPQKILKENKQQFYSWLEQWKLSWEKKEIESYINYYHQDFTANKMNVQQWKDYKAGLNQKYNFINVTLYSPVVYNHKNEIVVRFLQKYSSDNLNDFGEKTLYVKKIDNTYKIIGEEWKPIANETLAHYESKCTIPEC
ncbi:MAG: L,D-transpeptidase family protein [Bdellovibrionales bacterium]|nr:L,D-transpeptidase family protein [Bdellovibrionales bacterium]